MPASEGQRFRQVANEREKLLLGYYADAIDVKTLKREQARINADAEEADSQLATDGEKLKQTKDIIGLARHWTKSCAASYRKAGPELRRMCNQAFFRSIRVRDGWTVRSDYEESFASLLGSHKGSMVGPGWTMCEPPVAPSRAEELSSCIRTRTTLPTT